MDVVFLGLSISSSWGNGHATTYRGLVRELVRRGHRITFLERDVRWYASHRDLRKPDGFRIVLYRTLGELRRRHRALLTGADAVVVGSYVPQGIEVANFVLEAASGAVAFYDIDTPITVDAVERDACEYLDRDLVPRFDVYLSFTGGPTLRRLERVLGAQRAVPLYCSVDPEAWSPVRPARRWQLGYLGTWSASRQPALEELLLEPARRRPDLRFVVAGPQYPRSVAWPRNVRRIQHVPPARHPSFYGAQALTLNLTRAEMVRAGWSPSVRLFEAAACGVPIVSDAWKGIEDFFEPGREILIATCAEDVLGHLDEASEARLAAIGAAARRRMLAGHTAAHRAAELEKYLRQAIGNRRTAAASGRR